MNPAKIASRWLAANSVLASFLGSETSKVTQDLVDYLDYDKVEAETVKSESEEFSIATRGGHKDVEKKVPSKIRVSGEALFNFNYVPSLKTRQLSNKEADSLANALLPILKKSLPDTDWEDDIEKEIRFSGFTYERKSLKFHPEQITAHFKKAQPKGLLFAFDLVFDVSADFDLRD